jgi:hypothetical protein
MSELLFAFCGVWAGLSCYFICDVVVCVFTGYSSLGIEIRSEDHV